MIRWKDNADYEKAVLEALTQNGLSVRTGEGLPGKRIAVREGNGVRVIELPNHLKLNKMFSGKGRMVLKKPAGNRIEIEQSYKLHMQKLALLKQNYQAALMKEMLEIEEMNYRRQRDLILMAFRSAALESQKTKNSFRPFPREEKQTSTT